MMRTLSAAPATRMSVPATTLFNIENLRRFDGPGIFLGYLNQARLSLWPIQRKLLDREPNHR